MKTIVVIGAGPAGLTAASELLRQEREPVRVIVLEASGEIGGISRTVQVRGRRMDIGGHRFFSKSDRVMSWWRERLPLQGAPSRDDRKLERDVPLVSGGPDPETDDRVMLVRRRVSRIYSFRTFFDYPVRLKWKTLAALGPVRTVRAGFSYVASSLHKREEKSLEDFYINRFGTVLYRLFFEKYTEKVWGRHPSTLSAAWGAQRVKGLSIRAVLGDMFRKAFGVKSKQVETSLIEQFWYPKYGPGQLWETVADEVVALGGDLRKDHCVTGLVGEDGHLTAVLCDTPDGPVRIEADAVFSSMPLKDLVAGLTGFPVPEPVSRIAAGLPYRDFITVGLLVRKLKLENRSGIPALAGLVPDCWIYIQEPDVLLGRVQLFNNWSPYLALPPEEGVWLGLEFFCNEGDTFWSRSDDDLIRLAVREMEQIGMLDAADVLDTHLVRVKKAYPAYFDTYGELDALQSWLNGIDNLYCIGRNGQHRYNNMDHSMLTAFEAVDLLLSGNPDKERLWNVNAEKTYHETKA